MRLMIRVLSDGGRCAGIVTLRSRVLQHVQLGLDDAAYRRLMPSCVGCGASC